MRFLCLGYGDESLWNAMSPAEREAAIEECFACDDQLLQRGHWLDGGQALQPAHAARTLRWKQGRVIVTDGPFAETKEQLGGVGVLQARDMDHAVELVSRHPGLRFGPFEIRPIDEQTLERSRALEARHRADAAASPGSTADALKFAALGYINEQAWEGRPQGEFEDMIQECIAFDEARRRDGQWLGGFALRPPATARTLRSKGNKVIVTDGPYAETREWLGGLVVLQFRHLTHAVELLSTHPGLRHGVSIEIRPIDEATNARWEARQERSRQGRRGQA